jgi:hypothetical protein
MSTQDETDPRPTADDAATLEVTLRFRQAANWFLVSFALLAVVGAIITFAATNYDRETDFIHRFYGVFNPCIFIDHYPANVFGIIAFCGMLYASMFFMLTLLLYVRKLKNATQLSISVGFFVVVHYLLDLIVLDVFAANLYPHGDQHLKDAAGNLIPLGAQDVHHIKMHTFFYLAWLVGNLCAMIAVYQVRVRKPLHAAVKAIYGIGALAVLHGILNGAQWMVNWKQEGYRNIPTTIVQWALKVVGYAKVATLHPIAFLLFRHLLPPQDGVKMKFSLAKEGDGESVDPDRWIGGGFRLFGLALLGTYLLQNPTNAYDRYHETQMIILSGFRVEPYNYLFVPVFLAVGHAFCIGILLTIIRSTLMRGSDHAYTKWQKVVGGAMVALSCTSFWLIIPQFETSGMQAIMLMVLFPVWVFLTFEINRRTIVFGALWGAACITGIVVNDPTWETIANVTVIGMLMSYNALMPGEESHPSLAFETANVG